MSLINEVTSKEEHRYSNRQIYCHNNGYNCFNCSARINNVLEDGSKWWEFINHPGVLLSSCENDVKEYFNKMVYNNTAAASPAADANKSAIVLCARCYSLRYKLIRAR